MAAGDSPEDRQQARPEDRIEAALERIARSVESGDPVTAEVAARLDRIIETLRHALSN